jgi:hypothetical protein
MDFVKLSNDMQGASQAPVDQGRSQNTYSQETLAQDVPQEEPEEESEEEFEPRGTCGLVALRALNAAVKCSNGGGHRSPLQVSGGRCICTRCGRSVIHGDIS